MRKAIIAVIIGAAFVSTVQAKDNLITGMSPCQNWLNASEDYEKAAQVGYAAGFADSYTIMSNFSTRKYRYGEIAAGITQECYRDSSQVIAKAAFTTMEKFFVKK